MKATKIIIIAFILFVLTGMLILFFYTKSHENNLGKTFQKEAYNLPAFSVIIAEPESNLFTVESGKNNKLVISFLEKEKNELMPYNIRNDTLFFVEKFSLSHPERAFTIQCTNVHTIIARQNNDIRLCGFKADSLTFLGNRANLVLGEASAERTGRVDCHIKHFTIIGKNRTSLSMSKTNIDKMSLQLDHSTATFHDQNAIINAAVSIKNNSQCFDQGLKSDFVQLNFKSDHTSYFTLNKIRPVEL